MKKFKLLLSMAVILSIATTKAVAGPYTDELSKCLVDSTSVQDRIDLVKWMFSAASLHPAVQSISSVTAEQLDDANKVVADLVVNLLTESCKQETENALKYEGDVTIEASFRVLGQVAGRELFSSPEVAEAMTGLEKHLDEDKLKTLVTE